MDILEGNKLIGTTLFGAECIDDDEDNFPDGYYWQHNAWEKPLKLPYLAEDWEFHSNWNWTMPMIKICIEKGIWNSVWTNQLHDGLLNQNIRDCWEACAHYAKVLSK